MDQKNVISTAIKKHFIMWHTIPPTDKTPPGEWRCSCGLKFGFSDTGIDHQSEMIMIALQVAREAEAFDIDFNQVALVANPDPDMPPARVIELASFVEDPPLSKTVYFLDGDPRFAEANDGKGDAVRVDDDPDAG